MKLLERSDYVSQEFESNLREYVIRNIFKIHPYWHGREIWVKIGGFWAPLLDDHWYITDMSKVSMKDSVSHDRIINSKQNSLGVQKLGINLRRFDWSGPDPVNFGMNFSHMWSIITNEVSHHIVSL